MKYFINQIVTNTSIALNKKIIERRNPVTIALSVVLKNFFVDEPFHFVFWRSKFLYVASGRNLARGRA